MMYTNLEDVSDEELAAILYDHHALYCHGIRGEAFPLDFPRSRQHGFFRYKGEALLFKELMQYGYTRLGVSYVE